MNVIIIDFPKMKIFSISIFPVGNKKIDDTQNLCYIPPNSGWIEHATLLPDSRIRKEFEHMSRNILLVEPNYRTKFPPLGLMKISAYHKQLGDNVQFVKGFNQNIQYTFWDRIYITTLFTYNWSITVDTIKWYKWLIKDDTSRIFIGGIMSTLMADELWKETGIVPVHGLLNNPNLVGDDNDLIIEDMIPDYSLFDDSSTNYALLSNSYFGYTTRGCVRSCPFCGVPKLEPHFIEYKGIKSYINSIERLYGAKNHLILFDNNILASTKFSNIISDIMDLGFTKGAKDSAHRARYVDFNQGVDARYIKEDKFKLLSKISIHPLRIAFDDLKLERVYTRSIELAAKYDIRNLSNYILYNYNDTPETFWKRLKINIALNKEYDLQIYSFPMKYIPLNAKDRAYIGKNWNWQFIRGVQRILNVLKGAVMAREDFFNRAFGETEDEFITILHMPEHILMNRGHLQQPEEIEWRSKFDALTGNEKIELLNMLCENRTKSKLINAFTNVNNKKIKAILSLYLPDQESLPLINDPAQ